MRRAFLTAVAAAAALATIAGAAVAASAVDRPGHRATIAVIGDSPYGDAQLAGFPSLVDSINGDAHVRLALHLGDIKNGSSPCTDAYFAQIRSLFDTFADPLVYTPGDNEWTDCHRPTAGGYLPTERLAALRGAFYPKPGVTLGRRQHVHTQARRPGFSQFVENQLWKDVRVVFSVVHVVGSNNDLAPWFGAAETPEQRTARLAEFEAREAAALAWLERTFALAEESDAPGVVIGMQADMWDAFSVANGLPLNGFDRIVQRLAELAADFGRPVLLLQGDSHQFLVDQPLAGGDPLHGVTVPVPNLTRIVVAGSTASEWLRLTIDPRSPQVFSYERVVL
jgi:hypothetical protein